VAENNAEQLDTKLPIVSLHAEGSQLVGLIKVFLRKILPNNLFTVHFFRFYALLTIHFYTAASNSVKRKL
jgi:hypothetical protein